MPRYSRFVAFAAALGSAFIVCDRAAAQDLYDPGTLRTLNLQFQDADWKTRLRNNYVSETLILATLTVDAVSYPNVGVRIRGNTSYTALPAGSEKFSLKIEMDFVDADQELMGYDTLNLNNGFRDPTLSREVVYNNYVAQFIPNPRANNVQLTLNGENWGVYINVQQPDKRMLRDYFINADGLRVGCSNSLNGPGLRYQGPNATSYSAYQILGDGGLADPFGAFIPVTFALSNEPLATWQNIDRLFAIDPSIWSVALENLLTDDDSYINKGCDFMTYRDPLDNRLHLMQRDANETFAVSTWAITRNFTDTLKPVLNRVLAVPELRQRYYAHYRRLLTDMNWDYFGPIFQARRNLIEAAVNADPKKIYSYANFQNNFASTVNLGTGIAGGNLVGLQQFVNDRGTFLDANADLSTNGPTIDNVLASSITPDPSQAVYISAAVTANGSAIAAVELFYRPDASQRYLRVGMLDDGNSGDGAAGDGVFGVLLPITAVQGQRVEFYVGATAVNAAASASFSPALAELGPLQLDYFRGTSVGLRITEWMYSGISGEFIELTNNTASPIDATGWSVDDDHAVPGAFSLSAFGVIQPGESVVVTDALVTADFRNAWKLDPTVKIISQLGTSGGNNLGRGDQIHLFNADSGLEDRLFFGDQTYPGSIRTQNISGQVPCAAIGQNTVLSWALSVVGDAYGSYAANSNDVGNPGSFTAVGCAEMFQNGFEKRPFGI